VHRLSALEFLARWVDHVPERYETQIRYYGAFATKRRVWWRRRGIVLVSAPPAVGGAAAAGLCGRCRSVPALRR